VLEKEIQVATKGPAPPVFKYPPAPSLASTLTIRDNGNEIMSNIDDARTNTVGFDLFIESQLASSHMTLGLRVVRSCSGITLQLRRKESCVVHRVATRQLALESLPLRHVDTNFCEIRRERESSLLAAYWYEST